MRLPHNFVACAICAVIVALVPVLLLAAAASAGESALSLVAEQTVRGIEVTATVTDPQGRAVSGAAMTFLRRTAFGWLEVVRVTTKADGTVRAVVPLPPGAVPEIKAVAEIEDQTVQQIVRLDPGTGRLPRTRPGEATLQTFSPQPGFISPYPPVRLLATLLPVLLGVWTTYAVVVYQLHGIARNQ